MLSDIRADVLPQIEMRRQPHGPLIMTRAQFIANSPVFLVCTRLLAQLLCSLNYPPPLPRDHTSACFLFHIIISFMYILCPSSEREHTHR